MKLVSKILLFLAPLALLTKEVFQMGFSFFVSEYRYNIFSILTFQNGLDLYGIELFFSEILWLSFLICFLLGAGANLFVKD